MVDAPSLLSRARGGLVQKRTQPLRRHSYRAGKSDFSLDAAGGSPASWRLIPPGTTSAENPQACIETLLIDEDRGSPQRCAEPTKELYFPHIHPILARDSRGKSFFCKNFRFLYLICGAVSRMFSENQPPPQLGTMDRQGNGVFSTKARLETVVFSVLQKTDRSPTFTLCPPSPEPVRIPPSKGVFR